MIARASLGAVLCAALMMVGSCSLSSRARLHNETGQDVQVVLEGQAMTVPDAGWSRPFILASGPQTHWNRELRAGDCRYVFREPDVVRMFGVQRPTMSADPIVLAVTPAFTLEVFTREQFERGAGREPALSISAEKTCD